MMMIINFISVNILKNIYLLALQSFCFHVQIEHSTKDESLPLAIVHAH